MSVIKKLSISAVRNITDVSIQPSSQVNLLYGSNGSGKTSILESIHMLSTGRSFRSVKIDPLIQYGAESSTLYMELSDGRQVGLSRSRGKGHVLKLQGLKQNNWEEVARLLPVQVLDSTAFLLLEGSPRARRQFLDWGVFHVEPSFVAYWRNSRKCLANRNLLLKSQRLDGEQLAAWDTELCIYANLVDLARKEYFEAFAPVLQETLNSLTGGSGLGLTVCYYRGWPENDPLEQVLTDSLASDRKYGVSQCGPHRADIRIKIRKSNAVELLSRGQQKIAVCAMKIAQGILLSKAAESRCVFLVDDLPAELDSKNRKGVFSAIYDLGGQVFLTSVDQQDYWGAEGKTATFHVEHGTISALSD
jgi:DNA replication and repair protein RecF